MFALVERNFVSILFDGKEKEEIQLTTAKTEKKGIGFFLLVVGVGEFFVCFWCGRIKKLSFL